MDFNNISKKIAGACVGLAILGAVQANAAVIITDVSDPDNIPGLTTFATFGDQMDGMTVKARFVGGFTEMLVWGTTGANTGGVTGTDWGISVSGNTFSDNIWNVINRTGNRLAELWFNGQPGLTVFDIILNDEITIGSADGKPFVSSLFDDNVVVVTYADVVAVTPNVALGDLFHNMHADFSAIVGGGADGNFTFSQDTDNDSRLIVTSTPAMFALFGLSIIGLGWLRRKG